MLVSQLASWTADMWSPIFNLFSFIGNWGWMIVVCIICLKIILSPLDFWQKKVARVSTRKQAAMQPELQKLQKKFGNNKQMLNQKTMELYKRENFNVFGSCISMLVNMVITLFIFFTLFYGLMGISQNQILQEYNKLQDYYVQEMATAYNLTGDNLDSQVKTKETTAWSDAKTKAEAEILKNEGETDEAYQTRIYNKALEYFADTIISSTTDPETQITTTVKISTIQNKVLTYYNENIKEGWLWVDSVWRPDTNSSGFPNYSTFVSSSNFYESENYKTVLNANLSALGDSATDEQKSQTTKDTQQEFQNRYNFVTQDVQKEYSSWNGYFILVILSAIITYLSVVISQMQSSKKSKEKVAEQNPVNPNKAMKIMKFILPILMIIFTLGYSTAFALYIVTNSIMSTIISFIFLKIFERQEKKKKIVISSNSNKPDYSR